MKNLLFFLSLSLVLFWGCDLDDDDTDPILESDFTVTIENVSTPSDFYESGVFNTPVDASEPGPLFPGDAYEFTINAGPNVLPNDGGTRLSFVTMFVQSNDLFFAPDEEGIALYDEQGNPIGEGIPADVTNQVFLWDAGTEVNEATGGPNQKPQQDPNAEDVGEDENGVVTLIDNNVDEAGNPLPENDQVIRVTVEYMGNAMFNVQIINMSNSTTIQIGDTTGPVPLSPGVYVVHTSPAPLFEEGVAASEGGTVDSPEGLEDIAEDGFPMALMTAADEQTGLIVPLSPGVWAVHNDDTDPLFDRGAPDYGIGLEAIAEDGVPTDLANALRTDPDVSESGAFDTGVNASGPGAIGPGGMYEFTFDAKIGDNLSLATMFVQSNDWFYAFSEDGLDLFPGGRPVEGEVTSFIVLYDAGTEVDETPGAGLNQVIRQSGPDTGADDPDNTVRQVTNPNIPANSEVIKVTITAQ